MSELRTYWDEYGLIERSGVGRNTRAKELEALIHRKQKELKLPPYDFDARELRNRTNATPSINGPPQFDSKPLEEVPTIPQGRFTVEEAIKILGENECALLDHCATITEARMVYLAHVLDRKNPENSNVARRGQATNIAITEFNRMKNNGETI